MLVGVSTGLVVDRAVAQELSMRNELITKPGLAADTPALPEGSPVQNLAPVVKLPAGQLWPPEANGRPNPLWAVPIASLTATRERPIFSPSRRSSPSAASPAPQVQQSARGNEPDRPLLTLVGTVAGTADGIAIFQDENSKDIVRLRTGESHAGWTLTAVRAREVNLLHNRRTAILAIPSPSAD